MRNKYSEYYSPGENKFKKLWNESVFVFDANTLLNLYMYTEDTVKDFWKVFDSIQDRIWLSFQAGYEFHENRASRIRNQQVLFDQTIQTLRKTSNSSQIALKENFENIREHPSIQEDEIINEVSNLFESLVDKIKEKKDSHPDLLKEDDILSKISNLFEGKIGEELSDEEIEEILKEGAKRYENKVPPGFKDAKEKDGIRKYGDLIIWKEILKYANNSEVKSVIFITDDRKEDWWKITSGRTIGPHPKLIKEFNQQTSKDYYQYSSVQFLKFAKNNLIEVSEDSISETKRVANTYNLNKEQLKISQDRLKDLQVINHFKNLGIDQEIKNNIIRHVLDNVDNMDHEKLKMKLDNYVSNVIINDLLNGLTKPPNKPSEDKTDDFSADE